MKTKDVINASFDDTTKSGHDKYSKIDLLGTLFLVLSQLPGHWLAFVLACVVFKVISR